jgi:enamine deaminase RidA (YjgF/YER057c/UK114 family)
MADMRREVLLDDERGRGFAAVLRYGPYVFMSQSDGHRDPNTETFDPSVAADAIRQVDNSYSRVTKRLAAAGLGSGQVVRAEHFVSSQDWLILRLAQWREHFGLELCTGGGAQVDLQGLNMVSTVAVAVADRSDAAVVTPPPGPDFPGEWWEARRAWCERAYRPSFALSPVRPSKAVRAGDLVFTIGARGMQDPRTGERAPEETGDALAQQVQNCLAEFAQYLEPVGAGVDRIVRLDAPIRSIVQAGDFYRSCMNDDGKVAATTHVLGSAIGARGETDIEATAVVPGVAITRHWSREGTRALGVRAAGLVFTSGCSGVHRLPSEATVADLYTDPAAQARQAVDNIAHILDRLGSDLGELVRLDVTLADAGLEPVFLDAVLPALGPAAPPINFVTARVEHGAHIEVSAIAAAPGSTGARD